jgi:hypothetical protein
MDFGCSTTVSATPVSKRYNVNIKSAYNSNPALSKTMSIRAFLNLETTFQALGKSFCTTGSVAYRVILPPEYFYSHSFDDVFPAGYLRHLAAKRKDPRHCPTNRCGPFPPDLRLARFGVMTNKQ